MRIIIVLTILGLGLTKTTIAQKNTNVVAECISMSKREILLVVKNLSAESIFLPNSPIAQEGTDTLWVDNIFSYKHNIYNTFIYSLGNEKIETSRKIRNINIDSVTSNKDGPMPFNVVQGALVELKPNAIRIIKLYKITREIAPSNMAMRVFFAPLPTSRDIDYASWSDTNSTVIYTHIFNGRVNQRRK